MVLKITPRARAVIASKAKQSSPSPKPTREPLPRHHPDPAHPLAQLPHFPRHCERREAIQSFTQANPPTTTAPPPSPPLNKPRIQILPPRIRRLDQRQLLHPAPRLDLLLPQDRPLHRPRHLKPHQQHAPIPRREPRHRPRPMLPGPPHQVRRHPHIDRPIPPARHHVNSRQPLPRQPTPITPPPSVRAKRSNPARPLPRCTYRSVPADTAEDSKTSAMPCTRYKSNTALSALVCRKSMGMERRDRLWPFDQRSSKRTHL
jgi:hypothetical protein